MYCLRRKDKKRKRGSKGREKKRKRKRRRTLRKVLDTFLPIEQRVQIRPADSHGRGAQGNGLEDIGPALEAAVDVDLELAKDPRALLAQFQQHQDARL